MPLFSGFSYTPRIKTSRWLFIRIQTIMMSDFSATILKSQSKRVCDVLCVPRGLGLPKQRKRAAANLAGPSPTFHGRYFGANPESLPLPQSNALPQFVTHSQLDSPICGHVRRNRRDHL